MAFHCTSCNGSMVFDVASQQMRCLHCGGTCDPGDFLVRDEGIVEGDATEGMARFTCSSCGAVLEGTDDSLVGFCPYCGGQSMVRDEGTSHVPERLIPFQVDKDKCIAAWGEFSGKVPYLPAELLDPAYVQRFTGIYMPYWQFDVEFGESHVTGSTRSVHGNTETVKYYDIPLAPEGTYEGITFDASRYLDDELAERAEPFDAGLERPYSPAYLAGFYADASTVDAAVYRPDAENGAAEDMLIAARQRVRDQRHVEVDDDPSGIAASVRDEHLTLRPLWFLTWRKGDRVAHAVVNGASGKVVSDLPLDLRKFAVGCAAASMVLFVLLELLVQPTPMVTALVGLFAALLMARGVHRAAKQEWEHRSHANDRGWTGEAPAEDKGRRRRGRKKMAVSLSLMGLPVVLGAAVLVALPRIAVSSLDSLAPALLRVVLSASTVAYVAYVGVNVIKWHRRIGIRPALVAYLALLFSAAACAAVAWWDPVNDGWFYLADGLCIVGLIFASVLMIRAYNVSTMRPAPKLFDREEVQ